MLKIHFEKVLPPPEKKFGILNFFKSCFKILKKWMSKTKFLHSKKWVIRIEYRHISGKGIVTYNGYGYGYGYGYVMNIWICLCVYVYENI